MSVGARNPRTTIYKTLERQKVINGEKKIEETIQRLLYDFSAFSASS